MVGRSHLYRYTPGMATIADVAKAAGVSSSTVSYVLSGKRPISQATRHRVEKAIRDLGFSPHAGARALASSRTNVLGLVVPLRALETVSSPIVKMSSRQQALIAQVDRVSR